MSIYVQIGAGAGDLDSRADFQDGFSSIVKAIALQKNDEIILVEPNPVNLEYLKESWKGYPVRILNIGIAPSTVEGARLKFYYALEDGPNFQVASLDPNHVLKHYPKAELHDFTVECRTLSDLLHELTLKGEIALLSVDVEGSDAEIILDVDWTRVNCARISIEDHHMTRSQLTAVNSHLHLAGYVACGNGVDFSGLDRMYIKSSHRLTRIKCLLLTRSRDSPNSKVLNSLLTLLRILRFGIPN